MEYSFQVTLSYWTSALFCFALVASSPIWFIIGVKKDRLGIALTGLLIFGGGLFAGLVLLDWDRTYSKEKSKLQKMTQQNEEMVDFLMATNGIVTVRGVSEISCIVESSNGRRRYPIGTSNVPLKDEVWAVVPEENEGRIVLKFVKPIGPLFK